MPTFMPCNLLTLRIQCSANSLTGINFLWILKIRNWLLKFDRMRLSFQNIHTARHLSLLNICNSKALLQLMFADKVRTAAWQNRARFVWQSNSAESFGWLLRQYGRRLVHKRALISLRHIIGKDNVIWFGHANMNLINCQQSEIVVEFTSLQR